MLLATRSGPNKELLPMAEDGHGRIPVLGAGGEQKRRRIGAWAAVRFGSGGDLGVDATTPTRSRGRPRPPTATPRWPAPPVVQIFRAQP